MKFYVKNIELEQVHKFTYLGRILTDDDDDTLAINHNLRKARGQWSSIANILKREGASAICMAKFYLTVVQEVLLYGDDSWTITRSNYQKLQSFHRRATRYMTNKHLRKREDDTWYYPDHDSLLRKCRLFPIETYVKRRRGMLRRYLEDKKTSLLREAEKCGRHCKDVHKILWWQQAYLQPKDLSGLSNLWFS